MSTFASISRDVADNRPLDARELTLLRRLFSDPTAFPIEFKSWLVGYLETSDLTLPMSSILGLNKALHPPTTATQLTELADLRDRGALTEDEFTAQKTKLLEGG